MRPKLRKSDPAGVPRYGLDKIKFATDARTFEKAAALYAGGKVTRFRPGDGTCSATVQGSQPYRVLADVRRYGEGSCGCYLGARGELCKHLVAVAIHAAKGGRSLTEEDERFVASPASSGRLGALGRGERSAARGEIASALRYVKAYDGPSSTWFSYQDSLAEGCRRLAKVVSRLPVGEASAELLVGLLLRLDERLSYGGVDDSNGIVGGFIEETASVLRDYAARDPRCLGAFETLKNCETCFGWEEPLVKLASRPERKRE